ncbi:hypothetical protein ACIQYL_20235 [Lysinibacillus xylanilyticus]|uniref:hypothetical protein n=1 Tax=Lysinibacillus xylanilyticus TaxID=582475 RepID=UPI00382979BB
MFKKLFGGKNEQSLNGEENHQLNDIGIPQRGENATKKLLEVGSPGNREEIIAKSQELVEGKMTIQTGQNGGSPLMPNNLEPKREQRNLAQPLPVIQINNHKEGNPSSDSVEINNDYITPDERFYTEPTLTVNNEEIEEELLETTKKDNIISSAEQDDLEEQEIAAIIAAYDNDPLAETGSIITGNTKSKTTVRIVYDEDEKIYSSIFNFKIPLAKFIENYDSEVASLGYSSAIDEEGRYITLNPSKCYSIEIY